MSEKQALDRKNGVKAPEPPTQNFVKQMIQSKAYKVTYDGKGLSSSSTASGNGVSEWYTCIVTNGDNKKIGEYHVHPSYKGGFASGNMHFDFANAWGTELIGKAADWGWLKDQVLDQIFPPVTTSSSTASTANTASTASTSGNINATS